MLTLRSVKHTRTGGNISSFRSCPHSTGMWMAHLDRARIACEEKKLAAREARRLWLGRQWAERFEHMAPPSRLLASSGHPRQAKAR